MKGYRTYLLAALGTVYAISAYLTGHVDLPTFVQLIETSLGLGTLRAAIS